MTLTKFRVTSSPRILKFPKKKQEFEIKFKQKTQERPLLPLGKDTKAGFIGISIFSHG